MTHLDYGQFHDYVVNLFRYPLHDSVTKNNACVPLLLVFSKTQAYFSFLLVVVIHGDFSYCLSILTYKGIVRGKTIELEEQLPFPEGQPVSISVEPLDEKPQLDLPAVVRQIMHGPPHLSWEDVDELERAIEKGRLPVYQGGEHE